MNAFLRKVATVCVAFLLCASMGTIAFANDLPIYSEWAKAEVSAAENEGLLPFEMYDDCRRALHRDWATAFLVKFVEIATNASIEGSDVQVFDDVPVGHTMFEDINKAYTIGITKGTGDGSKFEPYRDVTREEYATMLYRTFDYIEQTIGQKLILRSPKMVSFADKDDISSWAIEALGILSNADLFRGTAEGMLDPKGVISIEQAIVLSYRGILLVQNDPGNPFINLRLGQCELESDCILDAKEHLLKAYMAEGSTIFEGENLKYLQAIKRLIRH